MFGILNHILNNIWIWTIYLFFLVSNLHGYSEGIFHIPSSIGTLGAGKSLRLYRTGIHQNPAGLHPQTWGFSIHTYQPFDINEIRVSEFGFFYDQQKIGNSFNLFSIIIDDLYQDHTLELQGATPLPFSFFIGASFILSYIQVQGLEQTTWSSSLGIIYKPWNWLEAGVYSTHFLAEESIQESSHKHLSLGFALYSPKKKIVLLFDIYHDPIHQWKSIFAQRINLGSFAVLSLGIESDPLQLSLQILVKIKSFKLGQTQTFHKDLGRATYYHLFGQFKK